MGKEKIVNDAKRFRSEYRDGKLYLIINVDDDGYLESVDMEQTIVNDVLDHKAIENNNTTRSGLEFVAALVNELILLGKTKRIVDIAARTSLGRKTLPGILEQNLKPYTSEVIL